MPVFPLTLAVNLSAHQFHQADICQVVADILHETGFPAEQLELEVTESALMQPGNQTIKLLHGLRKLGVRLALDDFGTGYSSLAYLKHFPLHMLKIDKSFVDDIPHSNKDMRLVSTIIFMAKSMEFKVLAEGVERQEQLDVLKELGCDLYQGYFTSEPVPADEFVTLLKQGHYNVHSFSFSTKMIQKQLLLSAGCNPSTIGRTALNNPIQIPHP
jgi:EAL domain-containing protein (putative c-di-GMP-specific phosphodiesterase class I)